MGFSDKVGDGTYSFQLNTPDGQMWVHIIEEDDKPIMVNVNIGKTGSVIQAWAAATSHLITEVLKYTTYHKVVELISNITTDKIKINKNVTLRSGPEAIATAFLWYGNEKFKEANIKQTDSRISGRLLD